MKGPLGALVYFLALVWLWTEVFAMLGAGNWIPMALFAGVFVVAFVQLGCLTKDEAALDRVGNGFALLIGLALVLIGVFSFGDGALGAVVRLIFAGIVIAQVVAGFRGKPVATT